MRLVGTIDDERKALTFSQFLHQKKIPNQIEILLHTDWDSSSYGSAQCHIWIEEEDHFEEVMQWLQRFINNPEDPFFAMTETPSSSFEQLPPASPPDFSKSRGWNRQPMGWITRSLLGICTFLFFLNQFTLPSSSVPDKYAGLVLFSSPVDKALLYDYPKFYELIYRFVHLYGYEELEPSEDLPPQGTQLLKQINQTLFWPGYYQLLLRGGWKAVREGLEKYPTFEKIQDGQIWRLITPCFLHGDLFHLFFNMLWLIVLGKQIEQRLTRPRYILFMLIVGIVSNTAQYLMSGPNFIGFSGILVGMLAFIWVRQKQAAWEGYQIDRLTFIFMLVFIASMAAIQIVSFFLEKSFELAISPNIANMAHLVGGGTGYILGKSNFFNWRHN